MKTLLSLCNNKFFEVTPQRLIGIIEKHDTCGAVNGVEALLDQKPNMNYLKELAEICRQKGLVFNLHASSLSSLEIDKNYLDYGNALVDIYGDKINIVVHSINESRKADSIARTQESMEVLFGHLDDKKYDLDVSIENLNVLNGQVRLVKEDLIEILQNHPNLKFTYDIGHEIVDGVYSINLKEILKARMNNIHISSHKNGIDHYPIGTREDDQNALVRLVKTGVDLNETPIVLEYGLDYVGGETFEEKVGRYAELASDFNNRIEMDR